MYSPVDSGSLCDCTGISTDDSDSHGSRHSSWAGIQTQRSTKERRKGGGAPKVYGYALLSGRSAGDLWSLYDT